MERVSCTPEAAALIRALRAQHGPLMFHQSGGCCDGSSPMCYPRGEFLVGEGDIWLGEIGGAPFYYANGVYYRERPDATYEVVADRSEIDAIAAALAVEQSVEMPLAAIAPLTMRFS